MNRHRVAVSIVSGAVALSAIGVGASAAATVGPKSTVANLQQPARATSARGAATVQTAKATVGGSRRLAEVEEPSVVTDGVAPPPTGGAA